MNSRRDLIVGGACVAAAGAAYGLKPRNYVSLLGSEELAAIVPESFGTWSGQEVSDPLALNSEGLSGELYNQLLVRLYSNTQTGSQILMLLAHGQRQSDALQLHRPEVCYPAFGYALSRNERMELPIADGVTIPARRILAETPETRQSVIYWSRLGEFFPADAGEQRRDRFRDAFRGVVPDGLLSRFSTISADTEQAWAEIHNLIVILLGAVAAVNRRALIGTERAEALRRAVAAR